MTDADTPRVPNFWWCPTHHLYRGGDERPCADAVKLGDVKVLRKLLQRAARLIQEAAEGLESANAPADMERAWLADWSALALLDREPVREEPNSQRTPSSPQTGSSAPRTLLGWTVPDHVTTREDEEDLNQIVLECWQCDPWPYAIIKRTDHEAVQDFLRNHAHGQVVEHQPEEADRG
ncbi:hypothetical protein CU254_14790 [Amycolatopsis sp. AA4]|uniref:hypothetical protein n=1 Tax=Actinomycetes TaxID=1760 RepID=UPI0001B55018|nr:MULTISPECIES: hypothetical protein [Actinomycetes]ATY11585.1 hypothetical protein CU254_14790 [Amycolatopsis sp. AA4]EFL07228.1 predicted protein [Streptomyces sp. AA4]